ncbi:MAG: substrate-binding domain-containing protein [Spirochaetes bacterium]|nr:substrate-binding domain-containing protein [Spirochaetota bacterium]
MKKINLKKLSSISGYSVSTISRALNDSNLIKKETKEKIKKLAKELDYYPNINAKALSSKKTYTIGIILFRSPMQSFANPFFIEVFKGINETASRNGYFTLNGYIEFDKKNSIIFEQAKSIIMSHRIDGVLVLASIYNNNFIEFLLENRIPFVLLGKPLIDTNNWIDNDNYEASYRITNLLFKNGYKNPIFISGSSEYTVCYDRFNGFIKALLENKCLNSLDNSEKNKNAFISFKDFANKKLGNYEKYVYFIDFNNVNIDNIVDQIVKRKNENDSAVIIDDYVAFLFLEKLKQLKINIPNDFGIVTFNNSFLSHISTPKLTTVETFPEILGEKITDSLLKIINDDSYKIKNHIVKTDIIYGNSI